MSGQTPRYQEDAETEWHNANAGWLRTKDDPAAPAPREVVTIRDPDTGDVVARVEVLEPGKEPMPFGTQGAERPAWAEDGRSGSWTGWQAGE